MTTLPEPLITISSEYLCGAPVFAGTRVPVQALFDYIEGEDPLDEFLDDSQTCPGSTPLPSLRWRSALR